MINLKEKKCLIAYFSRKGNNYFSGKVVNLPIGNTEVVAKMIQEIIVCDTFHIEAVNSYPEDYTETTEAAHAEMLSGARPELTNHVENMDSYDVIFLGYPNWWGTMPMPVFTFLNEYDFSRKIIIPFCTHEGSELGRSGKDIAKLCPKATLLKSFCVHGSLAKDAKKDVINWLDKIGIIS